jgi:hypothetical protein
VIALTILMLIPIAAFEQPGKAAIGALRSLGARRMSTEEYNRRVHDDIGAIFSLRLRFEAPEDHGVYVYAPSGGMPFGYSLERSGNNIRWVTGNSTLNGTDSPGFLYLRNQFGDGWLFLPARAALEWEVVVDSTNAGHEDARSIFVKQREDESPREVTSTWFATPTGDPIGDQH